VLLLLGLYAVVYSSVTIWTAIFSRIYLKRSMLMLQWLAVMLVFGGLAITASDSLNLGPNVARGTTLVFVGSIISSMSYVMSEARNDHG
jgi:drug/metabolite transporter (DMT)-like permease